MQPPVKDQDSYADNPRKIVQYFPVVPAVYNQPAETCVDSSQPFHMMMSGAGAGKPRVFCVVQDFHTVERDSARSHSVRFGCDPFHPPNKIIIFQLSPIPSPACSFHTVLKIKSHETRTANKNNVQNLSRDGVNGQRNQSSPKHRANNIPTSAMTISASIH